MRTGTVLFVLLTLLTAFAQSPQPTQHLYVITLNGTPVNIDGDLKDWQDADFVYVSQDGPNHQWYEGAKPTASPADFSYHAALKMDDENLYFAVHVRDEGGVLIHSRRTDPKTYNTIWADDHFAVYLGLYDIGSRLGSPHTNTVDIIDPTTGATVGGGRTYRVRPGADNDPLNATLGADYQIGVHIQDYDTTLSNGAYVAKGKTVVNYNWGYVDTTVQNTELAIKVWPNDKGYTLEWKVPFASLAGKIARKSTSYSVLEWPFYRPKDGDVIPFDFDVTDEDRPNQMGSNFLRFGPNGSLWRDSYAFGGRGIVRDKSSIIKSNYYWIQLTDQANVTIDGNLSDWNGIQFIGISQDSPNRSFYEGAKPTSSPADFSGYCAMRLDRGHLYLAAHVRDQGGVLIHSPRTNPATFNTIWADDHFATYLGLYDIGNLVASPHVAEVSIINPNTGEVLAGGRTYRIAPGLDNGPVSSTLGPDYQIGTHIQEYNTVLANGAYYAAGDEVVNYNWGYVDTTIHNTEVAIKVWPKDLGYTVEWKIPLASLAGYIAKKVSPVSILEWPAFTPKNGMVIPFDWDLTDEDRPNQMGSNFLRFGPNSGLWRDSNGFGLRGVILGPTVTAVREQPQEPSLPQRFTLAQNYPNPFNPITTIEFTLKQSGRTRLQVFNMAGQMVVTLLDEDLPAGYYRCHWNAAGLPSGTYVYRLEANGQMQTNKAVLMK